MRAYGTEVRKTAQQLRSAGDDARSGLLSSLDQSVSKFRQAQTEAQQLRSKLEQIEPAAGHAAHGTAGITRELIVLGHEALQGRFSRIPGSMMVLAERSGSATSAVAKIGDAFTSTAGIAAIAGTAIVGTLALIILKAHETEEAIRQWACGRGWSARILSRPKRRRAT